MFVLDDPARAFFNLGPGLLTIAVLIAAPTFAPRPEIGNAILICLPVLLVWHAALLYMYRGNVVQLVYAVINICGYWAMLIGVPNLREF